MSAARVLRTLRQKRLREVGEAGQARLFAASARVEGEGLRAELAVRYLVGAGIGELAAPTSLHAIARAVDDTVQLSDASAVEPANALAGVPEVMTDPEARAAFAGALEALRLVRSCLDRAP